MKKLTRGIVSFVLALSMLFSCAGPMAAATAQEEIPTIVYVCPMNTFTPIDQAEVFQAVSDYCEEKIGAKVECRFINMSDYNTQINLMISGGEEIDVYTTMQYATDAVQGKLMALKDEDIQKYAAGAFETVGKEIMDASKLDGDYYYFPNKRIDCHRAGLFYNNELAKEYGIDLSMVKKPADLEAVWKQVKEKIPGMYPLGPNEFNKMVEGFTHDYDDLGLRSIGEICVLPNYGQNEPLTVTNLYETQEYADTLKMLRDWYLKGYIYPDSSSDKDVGASGFVANKFFAYVGSNHACTVPDLCSITHMDIQTVEYTEGLAGKRFATTYSALTDGMAVPVTSQHVDKALSFINLMFTDAHLINLLNMGIEGKHYVLVDGYDNLATFPEGMTYDTCGYHVGQAWWFGNALISLMWDEGDHNNRVWSDCQEWSDLAIRSKALGFRFNPLVMKTEVAAISNVVSEYRNALECGEVDPDIYLPKFLDMLKAAGCDQVIAECQRQLDEWVAAKNN